MTNYNMTLTNPTKECKKESKLAKGISTMIKRFKALLAIKPGKRAQRESDAVRAVDNKSTSTESDAVHACSNSSFSQPYYSSFGVGRLLSTPTLSFNMSSHMDSELALATQPSMISESVRTLQMSTDPLLYVADDLPPAMKRSEWCMGDYQVVRKLYKGYASSVYKAMCCTSGKQVVIKAYDLRSMGPFLQHQVFREVDVHRSLQHPNIIKLHAVFKEDNFLVMILEYARCGNLRDVLQYLGGNMPEDFALQKVILPLLKAVTHMHDKGISHRDIKPENVLFTETFELKLADFGVAINAADERPVTRTGTMGYMAPEVQVCPLKRHVEDYKTDANISYTSVDVWSMGIMFYEMLTGFVPEVSHISKRAKDAMKPHAHRRRFPIPI